MFLHKNSILFHWLYPSLLWKVKTDQKALYITFDDGPIPEVTTWVLEQLEIYNAKATFFCVGENVKKHREIFDALVESGHSVGNHTYNHLQGWATTTADYLANYEKAKNIMRSEINSRPLFRPPYGRITGRQIKALSSCQIVMWDVLSGDFDRKLTPQRILSKSIGATRKGSIVVFHDNIKAFENLKVVLPEYLKHFSALGFKFEAL
jgi:peptidoglycan-N-acetylglucosamine deacetylase